ncbi:MAG TPA: helical backbone metal receptor [Dehalococcoidales bacterium]|nr:helical backbone metal receptor [Dehalococcoidales bacterium]
MKLRFTIFTLTLISILIFSGCQTAAPASTAPVAPVTAPPATTPAVTTPPITTPAAPVSTNPSIQFPLTLKDDAGRSVTLNAVPQRIVSLSPSNTEMVFALGLGDRLVGVTKFCNYPEAAKTKEVLGGFSDVNTEKVIAAQPDLILASSLHVAKVVPALEQLNIPVFVIKAGTIDAILDRINQLGNMTGRARESQKLTADLRERVEAVSNKIGSSKGVKPRILYVTWHDPIWTSGDDTIIGELIARTGGTNIASELKGYATITLETVVDRNPQIIIVMSSMGDNSSLDYINTEPRLQVTEAHKNKQVHLIDADIFGRTTPRIVDGLEQLAKIVQPELFK